MTAGGRPELVSASFAGAGLPAGREQNALPGLLARSVVHERAGAPIPSGLWRFGFLAAGALLATALLGALMPAPAEVARAHFFLVLGGVAAALTGVLQALVPFTLTLGCALSVLDLCLAFGRRHAAWRIVILAQAALGAAGLGLDGLLLTIVLFNLALWIMIAAAVIAVIVLCVGGALSEL
jgi:hypothetical protein